MTIKQLAEESANITHTYKVTPDVYYSFQRCSNDYNPLHTDIDFAHKKGFNDIVMYGNILNAFVSHFVGMLLPTRDVMIMSQTLNFQKPVFMNDSLQIEAKIDELDEMTNTIVYKLRFRRIINGKNEMVARGHVQIGLLEGKEEPA